MRERMLHHAHLCTDARVTHDPVSLSTKFRIEIGIILLAWVLILLSMARFRKAMNAARILSKNDAALKSMIESATATSPEVKPSPETAAAIPIVKKRESNAAANRHVFLIGMLKGRH